MAETLREAAEQNRFSEGVSASEEKSSLWMWLLLISGVILVCFASGIGQMCVMHCGPSGNCQWSPEDVDRAAVTCRTLGVMVFAGGLIERLLIGLRGVINR